MTSRAREELRGDALFAIHEIAIDEINWNLLDRMLDIASYETPCFLLTSIS